MIPSSYYVCYMVVPVLRVIVTFVASTIITLLSPGCVNLSCFMQALSRWVCDLYI